MSIRIENLDFVYSADTAFETHALKDVSLVIEKGSICGIMGRTGCGKSTLIQLIAGLYSPGEGKIVIDGEDINEEGYNRNDLRRKLGIVFQYPESQLFETTAYKDVAFGLKHSGLTDEEKDENIRWALTVTGFDPDEIKDKSPLGLSGGEKRRLAIAGVLAVKPEYLILDEPIAGLDPEGRNRFIGLMKKLNESGMTIIMVTHNADAVAECTDSLVLMKDGRIAASGEIHDVLGSRDILRNCGVEMSTAAGLSEALCSAGVLKDDRAITPEELVSDIVDALEGEKQ
jgi:energy-coupling factor transport system ATP-binding protein